MDATEYANIEADIVRDLTEYFVRKDAWDGDGWDDINHHIDAHWDDYFGGVPESDILDHAAPRTFDPSDWAGQDMQSLSSSRIQNIALGAVVERIHKLLDDETIGKACHIHTALDQLAAEVYVVDGAPNYSEVVHAFYTWLGDRDAAGDEFAHAANDQLGLQDFNETHVRRLTAIEIFGAADTDDYASLMEKESLVMEALWEWLNDQHSDYL